MWLPPIVTVPPTDEPVSLTECRAQCHIDGSGFDTELNIYRVAAREMVETYTATALLSQTLILRAQWFEDLTWLPVAPVTAVSQIQYIDANGATQTLDPAVYESVLIGREPAIRLKINQQWPMLRPVSDAVQVTVTAGYSLLPISIKQAILLTVEAWNESRDVGTIPDGAIALLSNYRRF